MARKFYSGGSPKMANLNASREKGLRSSYIKGESRATSGQRPNSITIRTAYYRDSLRFIPPMPRSLKENLRVLPEGTVSFNNRYATQ